MYKQFLRKFSHLFYFYIKSWALKSSQELSIAYREKRRTSLVMRQMKVWVKYFMFIVEIADSALQMFTKVPRKKYQPSKKKCEPLREVMDKMQHKTFFQHDLSICSPCFIGRDDRIWTCDHHTPSVVRYQTALRPERDAILLE